MLHEWIQVDTFIRFLYGLAFFLTLYIPAQVHRLFIFPLFVAQRYLSYILKSITLILLASTILLVLDYYWLSPELYQADELYQAEDFSILAIFAYQVVICIISIITITALFLMSQYPQELLKRSQDEARLSEMKIKYLNAQLNPHFLFNTFNNLHGLSLTDPSRVPELIIRLSSMMRYQVENGSKTTVSLADEITFIENYITMERERLRKRCDISFEFIDTAAAIGHYQLAPLILVTLVENAFKHSITLTNKWFVNIKITLMDSTLTVLIKNSMADQSLKSDSIGMGLVNIKERLKLLYPGKYKFHTSSTPLEYETSLTLQIN
jgi:sensor histidine kinase YesM